MASNKGLSTKHGQDVGQKVKYSALPTKDGADEQPNVDDGEQISLLDNMEKVHIEDLGESSSDENNSKCTPKAQAKSADVSKPTTSINDTPPVKNGSEQISQCGTTDESNTAAEELDVFPDTIDEPGTSTSTRFQQQGNSGRPRMHSDGTTCNDATAAAADESNLDIVRKMSQPAPTSANYVPWRQIGAYKTLRQKRCQRIYARSGRSDDLALFYVNGRFNIMEAWCSHMGGPLFEGDIEDYNGRCHVMCPWHSYMFDLQTGKNEIGLEQKVYDLKLENGFVYVRYKSELSMEPTRKISEVNSRLINPPANKSGKPTRKDSVLENVMMLEKP